METSTLDIQIKGALAYVTEGANILLTQKFSSKLLNSDIPHLSTS